jgi:tetratricopeptide (TPR) repeat protein/O-antigen ligase
VEPTESVPDLQQKGVKVIWLAALSAFSLIPLILLPGGYQFANLPKLQLLLFYALPISAFFLGCCFAGKGRSLPLPVLAFVSLVCIQLTRSLNLSEASLLTFVLTGSVTVAFGVVELKTSNRDWLFRMVAWTAGLVCVIGVLESWGLIEIRSAGRPSATLGFRNTAAAYAIGCLPWCVYLMTRRQSMDRLTGALTSGVVLLFILYTRSRGAWMGLVVSSLAVGSWYLHLRRQGVRSEIRKSKLGLVSVVVLGILFLGSLEPAFEDISSSRLDEKKQSIQETVRSLSLPGGDRDRLVIWSHTFDMFADHVLFGVGMGNWSAFYPLYDGGDVLHINSAPRRPHNDYLWIASELGIVGIGLFAWCLISALHSVYQRREPWRIAASGSLIAVATHSLFSFPREQVAPSLILWLAIALCLAGTGGQHRWGAAITWFMLMLAAAFGAGGMSRAIHADGHFARALVAQKEGQLARQLSEAQSGVEAGPYDHRVFLLLGDAQMADGQFTEAVSTYQQYAKAQPFLGAVTNNLGKALNAVGEYATAEGVLLEGRAVLPDDRFLIQNLSEAYRRQDKVGEALSLYNQTTSFSVDEHQNLGLLYAEADSLDRALFHYDEVLRMAPDRSQAVYSKAGIHLIQGRLPEAIDGYVTYLKTPQPNPTLIRRSRGRLREAYVLLAKEKLAAGKPREAIRALENRVRLGEMTAEDYHTLSIAYGQAREFGRAEDEARKALRLDGTMAIARLTLANALYEQRKREAFDHYAQFVKEWQGDPLLLRIANERLKRLER